MPVDTLIHTAFFYIPVNFAFNVNIMLLAICTTQVKKRVKKRFKKKDKKNDVAKNLKLFGNSNPDPQNQLELKDNASTH